MGKNVLFVTAAGLVMLALLISCTLSGTSDLEFAKELMRESAGATGVYSDPMASKSGGSTAEGLTITVEPRDPGAPATEPYVITITFDDYTPRFAPNSLVNGVLTAEITIEPDPDNPSVSICFLGNLTVEWEHAGSYDFEATLTIELSTEEYMYSGDITINGKVYKID
jgi:hypothetical protein